MRSVYQKDTCTHKFVIAMTQKQPNVSADIGINRKYSTCTQRLNPPNCDKKDEPRKHYVRWNKLKLTSIRPDYANINPMEVESGQVAITGLEVQESREICQCAQVN